MIIYNAKIDNEIKSIEIKDGKIIKIAENTCCGDFDAKYILYITFLLF